jgi:(2R)-3-sulfolactate dehydrogenase (NADP+)
MAQHRLDHLRTLAAAVLERAKTRSDNARIVAEALIAAEADGLGSHGLSRLPAYADQALAGKVDGFARPTVESAGPAAIRVDAATGFAFPAIRLGLDALIPLARAEGIAALAIANSHHFGVAGQPVERLAEAGLVALGFGNSPAAIAPWGGAVPLYGTNPIAFAWPRRSVPPLVIDLSLSKVARGKIMVAAQKGEPIPEGWALDQAGRPTTDATAALAGAMLPMGDAKGAALVLMVELMATALTGSLFGFEASSFFDAKGPPPRVGQLFIAIAPERLGGNAALDRAEALFATILALPGTRLPGQRRLAHRQRAAAYGIAVPDTLYAELQRRAGLVTA